LGGKGAKITGVVAALPAEARCVLEADPHGGNAELQVRISGIGGERAARAARQLLDAGAEALLCFGVGGALDPALHCGDIVLATEVLSSLGDAAAKNAAAAFARLQTAADWRQELADRLGPLGRLHIGAVMTSEQLVDSAQRKRQLFAHSGALAVDMESAGVGGVARERGVPFMALRVIADTAQDSLPPVLHSALGDGAAFPHGVRFWWSLLSAPSGWPALARLGRRYQRARVVLAQCGRAGVAWQLPAAAVVPS
jgi:adenosylhomocysteine nucleosidase